MSTLFIAVACLRFRAVAGARVALRNSWVGVLVAIFFVGMAPNPLGLLHAMARSVAAEAASPWALYATALLGSALAVQAAPQVLAGSSGWIRSLPVSTGVQRYATIAALVLVQAPVLVFTFCCSLAVALTPALHLAAVKLLAFGPIAVGSSMIALPARRRALVAAASVAAMLLALEGSVAGLAASLLALVGADALAGDAQFHLRQVRRRAQRWIPLHIAWRSMAGRALLRTSSAAVPLAGGWIFITNNELDSAATASTARICGVVAVVVVLAGLANLLHMRRPACAWERSLPMSSQRRILHDASSLAVYVVPVLLVIAMFDVVAASAVAAISPLFALLAAGAIRRAGTRQTAAAGEVFVVGVVVVTGLALTPWTVAACVAATPLALAFAARRERHRPASQWFELHHSVEGDAVSWSER